MPRTRAATAHAPGERLRAPQAAVVRPATCRRGCGRAAAAKLTGLPAEKLRTDPVANVLGGAALLAAEQRKLGRPRSSDPADVVRAVARYAGEDNAAAAAAFADDVFDVIAPGPGADHRHGTARHAGRQPALRSAPRRHGSAGRRLPAAASEGGRPGRSARRRVACESVPAPYEEFGGRRLRQPRQGRPARRTSGRHDRDPRHRGDLGDHAGAGPGPDVCVLALHDPLLGRPDRPARADQGRGLARGQLVHQLARPSASSTRASSPRPDAWYTEAMYRSSARLVRYLPRKYDIPLDRQHILGHDNVPGTTTSTITGMHTDPGPYWDWAALLRPAGRAAAGHRRAKDGVVTIRPDYDRNQPVFTGCVKAGEPCAPHGSARCGCTPGRAGTPRWSRTSACTRTAPTRRPASTTPGRAPRRASSSRWRTAAATGRRSGTWGRRRGSTTRAGQPTAVPAAGRVVTPKEGSAEIPVYGRAYPEESAYPAGVPVQTLTPLPYTLAAGQEYVVGERTRTGRVLLRRRPSTSGRAGWCGQGGVLRDPVRAPGRLREGGGCRRAAGRSGVGRAGPGG